jgi:hypothetical protein
MTMEFTVLNEGSTAGWVAKMIEKGFRVLWRPARFGETSYTVISGKDVIRFEQAPSRVRKVSFDGSSEGQQRIIDALKAIRVFA